METLPAYDAVFARQAGWTGADGAYTVALTETRILWLFGDTWYGEVRQNRHVNATIIRNSLAIQNGSPLPRASVHFLSGKSPHGRPRAFFRAADGRGWLWPYEGIRIGTNLNLFLVQVQQSEDDRPLGFTIVDSWLGVVANPDDPPKNWRLSQHRIPWGRFSSAGDTLFGSAVLRKNQYIYIANSLDFYEMASDATLYRPLLLRLKFHRN